MHRISCIATCVMRGTDVLLKLPQAASLRLPGERNPRWCSGCAKAHAGAVDVASKKCEGCGLKAPSFGLPAEGKKKRWCSGCAKGHPGAVKNDAAGRRKREGDHR